MTMNKTQNAGVATDSAPADGSDYVRLTEGGYYIRINLGCGRHVVDLTPELAMTIRDELIKAIDERSANLRNELIKLKYPNR